MDTSVSEYSNTLSLYIQQNLIDKCSDHSTTTTTTTTRKNCVNLDMMNSIAKSLFVLHHPGVMDVGLNDLAQRHATDLNKYRTDCYDIPSSWKNHPLNNETCINDSQNCLLRSLVHGIDWKVEYGE